MNHSGWKGFKGRLAKRFRHHRTPAHESRPARSRSIAIESLEARHLLAVTLGTGSGALLGGDLTDVDGVHSEAAYNPPGDFGGFDARFFSSDEPGFDGAESAFNVFDNRVGPSNDKWCCGTSFPQIVGAEFSQAHLLTHFTVASGNDTPARQPRVWTIDGSNDGTNWTTIFSQNDAGAPVWSADNQVIRFDAGDDFPAQSAAYSFFRMRTTATGATGANFFQIGEIEFFGDAGLTVVGSTPADGALLATAPTVATLQFGLDVKGSSVDATDLTVDGVAALGFRLTGAATIEFDLPALSTGQHTLAIAAGAIEAQQAGIPAVQPFSASFTIPEPATIANLPANNISASEVQLGVEVLETGGHDPDILLYWGDNDGATNLDDWDDVIAIGIGGPGLYTSGLSGLTSNTQYFYRAFATNLAGGAWAPSTATFTTVLLTKSTITTQSVTTPGAFAAEIAGTVIDTGGDVPVVTIFYGKTDGGTNRNGWEEELFVGERINEFSFTADGLVPETTYFYRALAVNGAGESWSPLTRQFTTAAAPQLLISELMAKNDSTLTTRTRASAGEAFSGEQQTPDWIEIANISPSAVEMGGLHLTDSRSDATKWQFPTGTTIPAGGFLVVFASGVELTDPALDERGYLHTDFSLDIEGEYLALTTGDGTVIHEYEPGYPFQVDDVSYGIREGQLRYFATPTPGAANSTNFTDLVADTTFTVDRGFFDSPFEVEIATATAGATIRYTLDGTEPGTSRGLLYSGPILVSATASLRAMAFKPGFRSTNVDTQTYLFLADVVTQTYQSTLAAGFPSRWGNFSPDYGLDPGVVGPNDRFDGLYTERIFDSLRAIPTLSLTMNIDDMFGPSGIYSNSGSRGVAWERRTSVELIQPGEGGEFQIDAGIRIQGGAFRSDGLTKKHGLRLLFKGIYGDSKLRFPFFGDDATGEFDTITLRAESNDGWQWGAAGGQPQYARDEFGRRVQLAMGQPSSHGNRVHLYINGIYWGVYNAVERPDAGFAASYFDLPKDDWDGINTGRPINAAGDSARARRTGAAWSKLVSLAAAVRSAPDEDARTAAFQLIQGNNPDGTRNPEFPVYLDVDNMIDYLIVNYYGGNADWPHNNYYLGRDSGPDSTGFKFFMWDAEWSLFQRSDQIAGLINRDSGVAIPFQDLRPSAEFRLRFADRVQKHLFNGGALYVDPANPRWDPEHPERNVPASIYMSAVDKVPEALVAESARWGNQHRSLAYTVDVEWQNEFNRLMNSWFPNRSRDLLRNFRQTSLFPSFDAPTFGQHGGPIEPGFELSMAAPDGGTIYFTTDGSDPRLQGGAVSDAAAAFADPQTLNNSALVKARVLRNGQWSALTEAVFTVPVPTITISEVHFNPAAPTDSATDNDEFEFIEIYNHGEASADLSSVQFVGGVQFDFALGDVASLASGEYAVVVNNLDAFSARYDTNQIKIAGEFQLDTKLDNSGEKIELRDAFGQEIAVFSYKDNWYSLTDGDGFSLTRTDSSLANFDLNNADLSSVDLSSKATWQPSSRLHGSPGTADSLEAPAPGAIIFNELLTHTDTPRGDAIELLNRSDEAINVGGWFLSDNAKVPTKYQIAAGTEIPAGGFLVFYESTHFGNLNDPGTSEVFALSELGEQLTLTAADEVGLLGFRQRRSFAAAENGVSFGEYITSDGTSDFVAMQTTTFGSENALPLVGPVVIHEIMYNPANDDDAEFVELRNLRDEQISLAGWRFAGIGFVFPEDAEIEPDGLVLITPLDPELFRATHNVPADAAIFGPYVGSLSNAGESLRLFKPGTPEPGGLVPQILVDRVSYNDKAPWPVESDGLGPALQRIEPDQYGNDAVNWAASVNRGTPGDLVILPQITEVSLSSRAWSAAFLDQLAAEGLGEAGYSIPGGPAQWVGVPWSQIDQLHLRFSETVDVSAGDLVLSGINGGVYDIVDFDYVADFGAERFVATWTFDGLGAVDKLLVELSDAVLDASALPLDGNWENGASAFPSGNDTIEPGDGFRFRINVIAADVDADNQVTKTDLLAVLRRLDVLADDDLYLTRLDVNTDGQIDVDDLRLVLRQLGTQLPTAEPATSDSRIVAATDAVFVRFGAAGSPQQSLASGRRDGRPESRRALTSDASQMDSRREAPDSSKESQGVDLRRLPRRHHQAVDLALSSLTDDLPFRRRTSTARRR